MLNMNISYRLEKAQHLKTTGFYIDAILLLEDIPVSERNGYSGFLIYELLSYCYNHLGYYEKGLRFADICLEICDEFQFYPNMSLAYLDKAYAFMHKKMFDEAQEFYDLAYENRCKYYGENHLKTITLYEPRGFILMYQHRWPQAKEMFQAGFSAFKSYLGFDHISTQLFYLLSLFCDMQMHCSGCSAEELENLTTLFKDYLCLDTPICVSYKYQKYLKFCQLFMNLHGLLSQDEHAQLVQFYQNLADSCFYDVFLN